MAITAPVKVLVTNSFNDLFLFSGRKDSHYIKANEKGNRDVRPFHRYFAYKNSQTRCKPERKAGKSKNHPNFVKQKSSEFQS